MNINLENLITNLNGRRIFYLSDKDLGEEKMLEPDDIDIEPPPLLRDTKSKMDDLDIDGLNKIPFYETVSGGLRYYGEEFDGKKLYVYSPVEKFENINIIENKDLVKITPMFKYLDELWVVEKVKVKCLGIIKMFSKGDGWDWKWVGYSSEMGGLVRENIDKKEPEYLEKIPTYMKKLVEKMKLNKTPKKEMVEKILNNPNLNTPLTDTGIKPGDFVPIVKINMLTGRHFTMYYKIKYINYESKVVCYYRSPWTHEWEEDLFETINNGYIYIRLYK